MASCPVERPGLPIPALGPAGPELLHKAFLPPRPRSGAGPETLPGRAAPSPLGACPRATSLGLAKFRPDPSLLMGSCTEVNIISVLVILEKQGGFYIVLPALIQTRDFETVILELFWLFFLDDELRPLKYLVHLDMIFVLTCKYLIGPSKPGCWPFLVLVEVEDVVVYC